MPSYSIFTAERRATAAQAAQFLRGVCVLALATLAPDGVPRVAPVRRDARVSGDDDRGEELCVIAQGAAREIDQASARGLALRDYNREVCGPTWHSSGDWGKAPYAAIEPHRMVAALFNRALLGA